MLERPFFRHSSLMLCAQVFACVAASLCGAQLAIAQFSSPAASAIYNRAASIGSAGMGGASELQGINAYNALEGFGASGIQTSVAPEWKSIVVDSPEFAYKGHDSKYPVLSVKFFTYQNGNDTDYAVLSGSGDTTAKLWFLEGRYDQETTEWFITGARVRATFKDEHKQGVTKAVFSPDYSYVLTSSYDKIGRLWTIKKQDNIRAYLGAKDRLWSISPSPDGQYVAAACNDGRAYFWEALTVKKLNNLPNREDARAIGSGADDVGHEGPIFDLAFSPNSSFIATAGADGTVRIWNLGMMKQVATLKGHLDKVYSVCFSSDGSRLLTASRDKTARLWDPSTGEEICRFIGHEGAVRQATFAGQYVCTASDDGTVRFWSTSSGAAKQQSSLDSMRMLGSVSGDNLATESVIAQSNSRQQSSAGKPTRIAGRPKGVELVRFEAGTPVFSADVTDDLVYVVGGCQDGIARVWRVPGNARYFNNSSSQNANQSGYGLGDDPLAQPTGLK